MKKLITITALFSLAIALIGCNKKEEFQVEANDPSSVANSSASPPVAMNSNGTPLEAGSTEAPEPPKKN